jgi:protein phosphatase
VSRDGRSATEAGEEFLSIQEHAVADSRNVETGTHALPSTSSGDSVAERPTRPVRVQFGALSHQGKVRDNNEDHYLVTKISRSLSVLGTNLPEGELPNQVEQVAYGFVVADGMGGLAGGERASILAIRTGVNLVLDSPKWALSINDQEARQLIERMKAYFIGVDAVIAHQGFKDFNLAGMGTTLTVAYTVGSDVFIIHVGDSRAYLFRKGRLEQLTRDHTVAQQLAEVGVLRQEEVQFHVTRHVLTDFVGGPPHAIDPEIDTLELIDGDYLLLCSDGLTDMVSDREIADILRVIPEPDAAAQALVDRALDCGGRDNVTVILARYEIPGPTR